MSLVQDASNKGFHMHPALTDAVTHLGAVKDTERTCGGSAGSSRVPIALDVYRPSMLKKHVSSIYKCSTLLIRVKETTLSCICYIIFQSQPTL